MCITLKSWDSSRKWCLEETHIFSTNWAPFYSVILLKSEPLYLNQTGLARDSCNMSLQIAGWAFLIPKSEKMTCFKIFQALFES